MNTLIIGACSAIAEATARILAERGAAFYLVARDPVRLRVIADDLSIRGARSVDYQAMDANNFEAHEAMLEHADRALGGMDLALIAHGTLSSQTECEHSIPLMIRELTTNGLSVVALGMRIAERLEQRRAGTLVVISSVAGDRGRRSNYVYGSAKAMVTAFFSGLRQRLHASNVTVITVKPGFVDTPMTTAFPKGVLWTTPQAVARGIVRSIERRSSIVYLPGFWRQLMLVVRAIPEPIFKRLSR